MAQRGWANIMVEATAVVPEGRISPQDMGIWSDEQIEPLKRIVDYVHAVRGKIGVQLAHAGRKASTLAPWVHRVAVEDGWTGGEVATADAGGWPDNVWGPSAISFDPATNPMPKPIDDEYIAYLKDAYAQAIRRCIAAGVDFIELHYAHGYLMNSFVSPISNQRTDQYGGSLENRLRLPLEVATMVRKLWDGPLLVRVTSSDWLEKLLGPEVQNGEYKWWGIEQTTIFAQKLKDIGIDLLDVSSGGNDVRGGYPVGPNYQVPFAAHIKKNVPGLLVGAVGLLTDAKGANDIIAKGEADICFFGREVLRDIDFPLDAAQTLGVAVAPAPQYERAWTRMLKPIHS